MNNGYYEFGNFSVFLIKSINEYFLVDTGIAELIATRQWCLDGSGYLVCSVNDKLIRLHQLVLEFYTGKSLKNEKIDIDHINGDKKDNRLCNLRAVSHAVNAYNCFLKQNNKTGCTGVCKTKNDRYRAYITINKKQISLGVYDSINDAINARLTADNKFGIINRQDLNIFLDKFTLND